MEIERELAFDFGSYAILAVAFGAPKAQTLNPKPDIAKQSCQD